MIQQSQFFHGSDYFFVCTGSVGSWEPELLALWMGGCVFIFGIQNLERFFENKSKQTNNK
jgi:hypothetical protein